MAHALPQHRSLEGAAPRRLAVIPGFGGGPPTSVGQPPVSNAQLAVLILIAFEVMTFAGLLTAYWVLRASSFAWPPPDLPRLPLAVTWVNTGMLLFSAWTMSRATAAVRALPASEGSGAGVRQEALRSALLTTAVLGTAFLAVQGTEWARLIGRGLTLSSSVYGATFYTLIGLHAVHVAAAVIWLLAVLAIAYRRGHAAKRRGAVRPAAVRPAAVRLCAMYWYFVCALWVVLFGAVYLY